MSVNGASPQHPLPPNVESVDTGNEAVPHQGNAEPQEAKEAALKNLEDAVYRWQDCDGRRRLVLARDTTGVGKTHAKSRLYGFFNPRESIRAGKALHEEFDKLQEYCLSPEDKALCHKTLMKMKSGNATVNDLRRLNALMKRVTHQSDPAEQARKSLKFCANKFGKLPPGTSVVLSDQVSGMAAATFRTSSTKKRDAGQWFAAMFRPLESMVMDSGNESAIKDFKRLMGRLERGELKSHEFADLYAAAARACNPRGYAYTLVEHCHKLATRAPRNYVLVWKEASPHYAMVHPMRASRSGRLEATRRLREAVTQYPIPTPPDAIQEEGAALLNRMSRGEVTGKDLDQIRDLIDRSHYPIYYAVKELNSRCKPLREEGAVLSSDFNPKTRKVTPNKHAGVGGLNEDKPEGERLAWRLLPLQSLFPKGSEPWKQVIEIGASIKGGGATAAELFELQDLVNQRVEMITHQEKSRRIEKERFSPALQAIDRIEASLKPENVVNGPAGPIDNRGEYTYLKQLNPYIKKYSPDDLDMFQDLTDQIKNGIVLEDNDYKDLRGIVNQANETRLDELMHKLLAPGDEDDTGSEFADIDAQDSPKLMHQSSAMEFMAKHVIQGDGGVDEAQAMAANLEQLHKQKEEAEAKKDGLPDLQQQQGGPQQSGPQQSGPQQGGLQQGGLQQGDDAESVGSNDPAGAASNQTDAAADDGGQDSKPELIRSPSDRLGDDIFDESDTRGTGDADEEVAGDPTI